jgi:hypothetical protein
MKRWIVHGTNIEKHRDYQGPWLMGVYGPNSHKKIVKIQINPDSRESQTYKEQGLVLLSEVSKAKAKV